MERSLSYQARRELLQQMAPQYREASLSQKRTLLDAFVAMVLCQKSEWTVFNFIVSQEDYESAG